ncbi:MAG: DUF2182 domain-containing protein [Shimia sp.]|uniref:DUF2182 domain-containing protein n=1 Tax=Shimia sp. TaxID=1954381 RepID=UPI0025E3C960|nr:DUF2182 domain-containing protein [Shimia sp.]MCH2066676.1 DUF2182 domain-containing protein [Shimia sp.]
MSTMIADRIRSMTGSHWLALFGSILAAWAVLFLMAIPAEMRELNAIYGADFWVSLCTITPDASGFARVLLMWIVMSAAMMAPTALPAFATYDDLARQAPGAKFSALVGGYLAVWIGFSILAAGLQMVLFQAGLLGALGESRSAFFSAFLLVVAGLYQFSPMKEACLSKCRMPMTFFMQHWDEGPWKNGLRLGLICLGCCWALMQLAFVGGVMNIAFMGLATLIMIFEKLPDVGRWVTKPLGLVLLCSAAYVAAGAL